jgi:replicative DNA helicase
VLEAELLCRLVIAHEMAPNDPLLRDEYFAETCEPQWRFLKEYYTRFGLLPNAETFKQQFDDFEWIEAERNAQWLADEVAQNYLDLQIQKGLADIDALRETNPRDSLELMQTKFQELLPYLGGGVKSSGDLWNPEPEIAEAERRRENKEMSGITLGFDLLDEVTKGTQRKELEIYFARPGVGKSFIILWGGIAASRAGKKVALFSPEMERFEMGVRFQSYVSHVSSLEVVSGSMDRDDWDEYMRRLLKLDEERGAPIMFYEPTNVGRPFSTADIRQVILQDVPGIVLIDGLMLIEPVKKDKDIRKKIINTMAELKEIAVDTGVPIRIAHQANRQSEGNGRRARNAVIEDVIPGLSHMAESDAVAQYANRAIALARVGGNLCLAIRKNRNGPEGRIITMLHDIDRGHFREVAIINGEMEVELLASGAETQPRVEGRRRF